MTVRSTGARIGFDRPSSSTYAVVTGRTTFVVIAIVGARGL
jgi:hypothetical protein